MKKIIALILCLIMMLSFVSCNSNDYKLALELYDSGDYRQALIMFESLEGYQDSDEKLILCRYYLSKMAIDNEDYGKAIELLEGLDYKDSAELLDKAYKDFNEDNRFLTEINTIMLDRLGTNSLSNDAEKAKLDEVIETLSVHEGLPFYQEDLGLIFANFLEGLRLQRQALDEIGLTIYDQDFNKGKYLVCQALFDLVNNYDFLKEEDYYSKKLNSKYIKQLDLYKLKYDGACAINADITNQLDVIKASTGTAWTSNGSTISLNLTNNTIYKYTIEVTIHLYDNQGIAYDTLSFKKVGIKPDTNYTLSYSSKKLKRMDYITWEYQLQDIYEFSNKKNE